MFKCNKHVVLLMQGWTALHCAAISKKSSTAKAILSHSASNIDARSNAVRCCVLYAMRQHAMAAPIVCSLQGLATCT